jgi:hypothetical protein
MADEEIKHVRSTYEPPEVVVFLIWRFDWEHGEVLDTLLGYCMTPEAVREQLVELEKTPPVIGFDFYGDPAIYPRFEVTEAKLLR